MTSNISEISKVDKIGIINKIPLIRIVVRKNALYIYHLILAIRNLLTA